MVVGAATDELHPARRHRSGQSPGVVHHAATVELEVGLKGLGEGHGLAGDHVHQRAALRAGKHRPIEILGVLRPAHRNPATGAAEGLVGGARDEVGYGHRIVVDAGSDQARVVGHVDEQLGPDLAGDLGELPVGNLPRVGACPGHDQLRLVLAGQACDLVEVEQRGVPAHAVVDELVEDARAIQLHAMSEMTAVGEIEGEHGIARLDRSEVHGRIGLTARVRLDVGVLRPKDRLEPLAGQVFHPVDELAAAVVAAAGIALGVFVGEHAADCLHHSRAGEVFAGDQFQPLRLPLLLGGDSRPDLGIFVLENVHGETPGAETAAGTKETALPARG